MKHNVFHPLCCRDATVCARRLLQTPHPWWQLCRTTKPFCVCPFTKDLTQMQCLMPSSLLGKCLHASVIWYAIWDTDGLARKIRPVQIFLLQWVVLKRVARVVDQQAVQTRLGIRKLMLWKGCMCFDGNLNGRVSIVPAGLTQAMMNLQHAMRLSR